MAFSTGQSEMNQPAIDLVGYKIDLLVGSGSYSSVYRMIDIETNNQYAVKIANLKGEIADRSNVQFPTRAWFAVTDAFAEAQPDPGDLLERQYGKYTGIECSGWVTAHEVRSEEGRSVAIMDWVDAANLRDLMSCSSYGVNVLESIAGALNHLIDSGLMLNHGDLKPENILVSVDGTAMLIDPGYFGPVAIDSNEQADMCVTTWQYYPWLKPNDMFAFGLLTLELCAGVHPFYENLKLNLTETKLGTGLQAYIDQVAGYGNQFVKNVERLPAFLDRFGSAIPTGLKEIALTCMGIEETDDGTLELGNPFDSFGVLLERLSKVDFPEEVPNFSNNEIYAKQEPESNRDDRLGYLSHQPLIVSAGIPTGLKALFGEQRAQVRERIKIGENFRVAISPESEGDASTNVSHLSIFKFFENGTTTLLALTLPPEYTLEDPYLNVWFARVVDRNFLLPVSREETDQIQIEDLHFPSEQKLVALLGEFEAQAIS